MIDLNKLTLTQSKLAYDSLVLDENPGITVEITSSPDPFDWIEHVKITITAQVDTSVNPDHRDRVDPGKSKQDG